MNDGSVDMEAVTAAAEREWGASPQLRAEFADSKENYLSYRRAEARGRVKVLGQRGSSTQTVDQAAKAYAKALGAERGDSRV